MSDDNSLDDLLGSDRGEIAARQALGAADRAYRDAVASGSGVDDARAALRKAAETWERAFVNSVDPKDGPQVVREAVKADDAFTRQTRSGEHSSDGDRDPADETTGAEEEAKFFFPGLETLTEKEVRDDAAAARTEARNKLDELRKAKDRVFAELRDHYDIATALDREEYLEPGGDVGEPPPIGWGSRPVDEGAYPFGWSILKPTAPKLVVAGVTIGVIVIGGVFLFAGGGASSDGKSADNGAPGAVVQGDAFPATRAAETSIAAASTPGGPALSGNYLETISVEKDPAGHMTYVAMPSQILVSVFIVRDKSTGAITLTFNGPPPWVNVAGTAQFGQGFDSSGGTFDATGQGVVAGRQGVGVDLSGSIAAGGELQGSLTMGTNGVLPTGQAITYHIDGRRQ